MSEQIRSDSDSDVVTVNSQNNYQEQETCFFTVRKLGNPEISYVHQVNLENGVSRKESVVPWYKRIWNKFAFTEENLKWFLRKWFIFFWNFLKFIGICILIGMFSLLPIGIYLLTTTKNVNDGIGLTILGGICWIVLIISGCSACYNYAHNRSSWRH